ncbi:MAG: GTPase HflX [Ruminococcaceae bacterium]|nr:GTPase HflX [Oscillospiraceae bacterium]
MESINKSDSIAPKAVLVSVILAGDSHVECDKSLDELEELLKTAGGETFARMIQLKDKPEPDTYIGSGKLSELDELCCNNEINLVVFDAELAPSQIRNIENALHNVSVIDRTMLILDIFASHAVTREGILQVEIAHLKYTAPRLVGKGKELSRLGGGIGTRGPGESKLETDRRHIKRRITTLEEELRELEKNRITQHSKRKKSGITSIAVAGYTNAGKSTLMNYITGAGILAEDKLFATLDPTTRKYVLPTAGEVLITDTVGFINNLPHHLVKAFKSTLDEVAYADIILLVSDASDPEVDMKLDVCRRLIDSLLSERGEPSKPIIYVFNKCDKVVPGTLEPFDAPVADSVYISAKTGEGCDDLIEKIESILSSVKRPLTLFFPHSMAGNEATVRRSCTVTDVEYTAEGIIMKVIADDKITGKYKDFIKYDN